MFGFGDKPQAAPAPGAGDLIKDVTEASFMADVIEASRDGAGDRRFLGDLVRAVQDADPALEAAVKAAKGKVGWSRSTSTRTSASRRSCASSRSRRSTPSGRVSRWTASRARVPGSEIKAFVERLSALAGDGGLADALEAAEAMLAEGAAVDAAETFAAILGEEPGEWRGLWRADPVAPRPGRARPGAGDGRCGVARGDEGERG